MQKDVKEKLKLCGILLVLLLMPFVGLVIGALVDAIITGLIVGIVAGFGATVYLTRKLPKNGQQTVLWTIVGGLIAYICVTQIVGGKTVLPIVFMGAVMGAGASLVLPALQKLDEKRKQQR